MKKAVTLERKQASRQAGQRLGEASSSCQPHRTPTWEWIEAATMGRAFHAGVKWICRRADRLGWEDAEDTDEWGPDDWAPAQEGPQKTEWPRCTK
eukprot:10716675-Prorocentrum_lima.AAC.1